MADVSTAFRGFGEVARDLVGGHALFLYRTGDGVLYVVDLANHRADLLDGRHRALGVGLDRFDLLADVFRRFGCLLGQLLHFVGNHREAFACFTRACRFDGGVQGQQVGLLGNRSNDLDHLADLGAALSQFANGEVGVFRRAHGGSGNLGGV